MKMAGELFGKRNGIGQQRNKKRETRSGYNQVAWIHVGRCRDETCWFLQQMYTKYTPKKNKQEIKTKSQYSL